MQRSARSAPLAAAPRAAAVTLGVAALVALAPSLAGCNKITDPALNTAAAKTGSLGNGDFYFQCDDSVTCADYRNYASKFPDAVAEGSSFHFQYAPKDSSVKVFDDDRPGVGYTIDTVGTAVLSAPSVNGFTALKSGIGTVVVKNAQGALVDFTQIRIGKPDELVVYDADFDGSSKQRPTPITSLPLTRGDTKSYRTLARQAGRDLAGTFQSEWTSDSPTIVSVAGYDGGKVTLVANATGNARLTVAGAGLETLTVKVDVVVKEVGQ